MKGINSWKRSGNEIPIPIRKDEVSSSSRKSVTGQSPIQGSSSSSLVGLSGNNSEEIMKMQRDVELLSRKLLDINPQAQINEKNSSDFVSNFRASITSERKDLDSNTKLKMTEMIISKIVDLDRAVNGNFSKCICLLAHCN